LALHNNADFSGNPPGPSKLVQYDLATGNKTAEWDLPANMVAHTVSIVDGKYYVTDFGFPRIVEVTPSTGAINDSWFTSDQWDASISGMGGTIYDKRGGFYISQGNKLWYLPISNGMPGTLQEVNVSGIDAIDADGISWDENNNTLYYATNDTGDPANAGTVYKVVFSDATTATGSVIATGLDDASGVWYLENNGSEYVFALESQFGGLFGINSFEPPFTIKIIDLADANTASTPLNLPNAITVDSETFFPEDIVISNNIAYVSSLGDGSLMSIDLTEDNPTAQLFAAAEEGYTQRWGVKTDGTVLLSILDNANFGGGESGPAKLVAYDIASGQKTDEWDLPAGSIGHTVSIVDGKYYVTDFGSPRIFEIDPSTNTVNDSWFTSDQWDPSISGIGGTIYDNEGGFYISQGNKLWYLPISDGTPGALREVTVSGLDIVDADGISWDDSNNTLYYATNDTGDPANAGTAYKLVFSDVTTATGSIVETGFDDSSGLWYLEDNGSEYIFVLESQFGALFGINSFEPPFSIKIIKLP